jgi:hypothetical protein
VPVGCSHARYGQSGTVGPVDWTGATFGGQVVGRTRASDRQMGASISMLDIVAERLRRWTANPLGSPRVGWNPIDVAPVTSSAWSQCPSNLLVNTSPAHPNTPLLMLREGRAGVSIASTPPSDGTSTRRQAATTARRTPVDCVWGWLCRWGAVMQGTAKVAPWVQWTGLGRPSGLRLLGARERVTGRWVRAFRCSTSWPSG